MVSRVPRIILVFFLILLMTGCASTKSVIPINQGSVEPGTRVFFRGKPLNLLGSPVSVGKPLPSARLVDSVSLEDVDLSRERGSVLFLSIVPSIDTPVCEAQTHYLGEKGEKLLKGIKRITISRDTPFAQKRFAREARLTHLRFLSDYKEGSFGQSLGLLTDGLMLLARSIILVDKQGTVRYIQVVPEMSNLPDMERAFQKALELDGEK